MRLHPLTEFPMLRTTRENHFVCVLFVVQTKADKKSEIRPCRKVKKYLGQTNSLFSHS